MCVVGGSLIASLFIELGGVQNMWAHGVGGDFGTFIRCGPNLQYSDWMELRY